MHLEGKYVKEDKQHVLESGMVKNGWILDGYEIILLGIDISSFQIIYVIRAWTRV